MEAKKIIIIEDEALIAIEIQSTLEMLGYEVVGHCMNGDEALDLFASTVADLILLDINIKGSLNGIDLAGIIRKKYSVPFVFITSYTDRGTLEKAKTVMPYGYILKPFNENDLKVNIELALYKFQSEQEEESLTREFVKVKHKVDLTEREFSTMKAFLEGKTYKETADELFISVNTVKTYQKRLFTLFEVSSKFELIEKMRKK